MLPLIPIAISLATKFVPSLLGKLAGDKAGEVAEKVVGIASSITEIADPQKAHDKIMGDPTLQLEFEKSAMNLELELYKEDTRRLQAINQTMQVEATSKSLVQRAWRPFNGFMFGITLFCDYFVSQVIEMIVKYQMDVLKLDAIKTGSDFIPFAFTWEHIPAGVYMLWSAVLGVSAGSRGWEKVSKAKAQNGGQGLGLKDITKLFGQGIIGK
jgi:hypothetical protein